MLTKIGCNVTAVRDEHECLRKFRDKKYNLVIFDQDLPDEVRQGQRLSTMTSGQKKFPIAPSKFKFSQHGESGRWVSELLPHTAKVVDDIALIIGQFGHRPGNGYLALLVEQTVVGCGKIARQQIGFFRIEIRIGVLANPVDTLIAGDGKNPGTRCRLVRIE